MPEILDTFALGAARCAVASKGIQRQAVIVTCMPPSDRVMAPSKAAFTLLPATGATLVNKGGQLVEQVPEQLLVLAVSFANAYSVIPLEVTKNEPSCAF